MRDFEAEITANILGASHVKRSHTFKGVPTRGGLVRVIPRVSTVDIFVAAWVRAKIYDGGPTSRQDTDWRWYFNEEFITVGEPLRDTLSQAREAAGRIFGVTDAFDLLLETHEVSRLNRSVSPSDTPLCQEFGKTFAAHPDYMDLQLSGQRAVSRNPYRVFEVDLDASVYINS